MEGYDPVILVFEKEKNIDKIERFIFDICIKRGLKVLKPE